MVMSYQYHDLSITLLNQKINIFRNRFRACVNIMGDAYGAAIIEATSKAELDSLPLFENDKRDESNNSSNQAVTKL